MFFNIFFLFPMVQLLTKKANSSSGSCRYRFYEVSEASIFRLTTHAPTVPARPVLVPGADVDTVRNVPDEERESNEVGKTGV